MSVTYIVVLEVKTKVDHGEFLCLQKVYPIEDGVKYFDDQSYRFIRQHANGNLKAQRGQAQVSDLRIMSDLINEMKKKESPTTI